MKLLWSHRDFRLLAVGQGLSWFGDTFAAIALAVALLKHGSSASSLGLVMAAFTIGQLASVLIGGVVADRIAPTRVMVASDIVRGCIAALLAWMFATGSWSTPILATVFLALGIAAGFFSPSMMSLKQRIVPAEERKASNTALSILQTAAGVAGPAVAGVTVAMFGAPTGFALNAVSFVISTLCVRAIHARPSVNPQPPASLISDLKGGFTAITDRCWLRTEILAAFAYHLGNGVIMVLLQVIAVTKLGGAFALGIIQTCAGAGSFLGGLIATRVHPQRPLFIGGLVLTLTPLSLTPLIWPLPLPAVAGAYGIGLCAVVIFSVLYETSLQDHVPEAVYGRVVSWDMLGSFSILPVGTAAAGYLADHYGTPATMVAAIALMLAASLAPLAVRDVRHLTNEHGAAHQI